MTFPQKMILSAAAACACGWLCPDAAPVMKQIGGMFIDLLKMTVIPLAFISILYGIVKYGGEAGGMAGRALLLASVMTALAALIGMGMMCVLGVPAMDAPVSVFVSPEPMTVLGFMRGCIPVNPVSAFASGNMLQIITLAVFCGAVILRYFYCASVVRALSMAQAFCLRAADMVMRLAPVGVFALLYSTAASCPLNLLIGWASAGAALVCGMAVFLGAVSVPCLLLFRAPLRVIPHMAAGISSERSATVRRTISRRAWSACGISSARQRSISSCRWYLFLCGRARQCASACIHTLRLLFSVWT